MLSRVQFGFLALSSALLVSCQVYPDPHAQPPGGPNKPGIAPMTPEQMELQKQRDEKKRLEAEKKKAEEALKQGQVTPPTGGEEIKPKPTKEKKDYPFANAVPGKEGFVFSPYNNQMVDVRGIASGTLVQDPTYQADEKKYFRVP